MARPILEEAFMKIATAFGTLLLGLTLPSAWAQGIDTAEMDRFITAQMKRFDVPGVGLAVVKDGKVVYTKGYGVRDLKTNTPVTADTLFAIGSSSKSFTSLGVMQQVDAGKLNLDAPINTYLPNLKFSDATRGAKVTLRSLLSMTSGLPRADLQWAFDESVNTRAKMLETIQNIAFTDDPGKVFQYCNQNFVAAGAALEAITGQSWEAYTKANIFAPLGMTRSVFEFTDAVKDGNYAAGHGVTLNGVKDVPAFDRLVIAGPAGSIHSSASDMARYVAFQLGNGESSGKRLVSKKQLEAMHTQQIGIDEDFGIPGVAFAGYGFGWFTGEYRGVKIVEHGGNIDGFTANMQILPEKGIGIVLLANMDSASDFGNATRFGIIERLVNLQPRNEFKNASYPAFKAKLEATRTYKPTLEALKSVEGHYALITGDTLTVRVKDGKLEAEQAGQTFPLVAASATDFFVDIGSSLIELEFRVSANGIVWLYQQGELIGVRLPSTTDTASSNAVSELRDPNGRFSLTLPAGQVAVNNTPTFSVVQYANPNAAFVFMAGDAKGALEASVEALVRQVDPTFNIKPTQTTKLPPLEGITWTQFIYPLPGGQTLAVLATQQGNTIYVIALQAKTSDLNALAGTLQQIASSYKILR
jgi:CubicO group peptidase (beta-lactamase class C family)